MKDPQAYESNADPRVMSLILPSHGTQTLFAKDIYNMHSKGAFKINTCEMK